MAGLLGGAVLAAEVFPQCLHEFGAVIGMGIAIGNVLGSTVNWVLGRFLARLEGRRWFRIDPAHIAKVSALLAGSGTPPFTTNDALYILGHYNADGTIDTSTGVNSSARAPESGEQPASVNCDAFTVLSHPVFTSSGSGASISSRTRVRSSSTISNALHAMVTACGRASQCDAAKTTPSMAVDSAIPRPLQAKPARRPGARRCRSLR